MRSRYVPLVLLTAVLAGCEHAPATDPSDRPADYTPFGAAGLLSVCSQEPERVHTALVGSAGGAFAAAGFAISVPAGAVPHDIELTVRVPSSPLAEIEVTANGAQHFRFNRPVTIAIDYGSCTAPAGPLTIWHIDPVTKAFIEDMGGVNDPIGQRVVFSTMHLSGYAIAN